MDFRYDKSYHELNINFSLNTPQTFDKLIVDIKDMDPESKEKILRALLNKINEGKQSKNFVKLKQLVI